MSIKQSIWSIKINLSKKIQLAGTTFFHTFDSILDRPYLF